MTYAFIQDVPADREIYGKIRAKLPTRAPAGLVTHVVIEQEEGLRYVDVWETEADWARFRDEFVEPVVSEVLASYGLPHDHAIVTSNVVTVIDTWIGETVPA